MLLKNAIKRALQFSIVVGNIMSKNIATRKVKLFQCSELLSEAHMFCELSDIECSNSRVKHGLVEWGLVWTELSNSKVELGLG